MPVVQRGRKRTRVLSREEREGKKNKKPKKLLGYDVMIGATKCPHVTDEPLTNMLKGNQYKRMY